MRPGSAGHTGPGGYHPQQEQPPLSQPQPQQQPPQPGEQQQQQQQQAPEQPEQTWHQVSMLDRVRAFCVMLRIGHHPAGQTAAAQQAAMVSFVAGGAFRETPYSDSVEPYMQRK